MSKKAPHRRRVVPPILAGVVQSVTERLARIEDLLTEMRHEQDVKLKRILKLEEKVDEIRLGSRVAKRV